MSSPDHDAAHLRVLADAASDAIVAIDEESRIIFANPATQRLFGWLPDELVGQSLAVLMPSDMWQQHRAGVARHERTGQRHIPWQGVELPGVHRDGSELMLEMSFGEYSHDGRRHYIGIMRDVTARRRESTRRAAEHAVSRILMEGREEDLIDRVIAAMSGALGWTAGALWLMAEDGRLCCDHFWAEPGALLEAFAAATRRLRLLPGEGVPGRAWSEQRAIWVDDVAATVAMPRREHAARAGLHAALAFPLRVQGRNVGVLECFSRRPQPADEALLETVAAIGGEIGQFLHSAAAARERAELVEQLERERARLAAVVEHAPVGIVIAAAPGGRILMGNRRTEEIFRHPVRYSDDVHGYAEWEAFHPDGQRVEGSEFPLARALQPGRREGPERYLYHRGDGTYAWVEITAAPIRNAEGSLTGALVVVQDVDAEVRAQEERERLLREVEFERTRLYDVFRNAPAFIATLRGPEHVFEMVNPQYLQLIGHRDVVGKPVREALPEVADQGFLALLDRVYATGEPYLGAEVSIQLQREPGSVPTERFLTFVYQPLTDLAGTVTGVLAHGMDVTDLVRAREAEAAANDAKSVFVATMSHELRTPLNAMLGYSQLLLEGIPEPIPAASSKQVERIQLAAQHLLQLIDEVLTFSRAEAQRERVDIEAVALHDLYQEVCAIIEPLAHAKGLAFHTDVHDQELMLNTDARKVRQILLNLLGNAVKFTESGWIRLVVARAGDQLEVTVCDTGIGIAPEHIEHVFEAFWQAETEIHARVAGTGLGLPVTRKLTEPLGGTIAVESRLGAGTTFRVALPLDARQAHDPAA